MSSLAFDFLIFCAIAAEIVSVADQCEQMAECFRKANDEMLKCSSNINAINVAKLIGGDFDQCSDMVKRGMMNAILAHDALTKAGIKCLTGSGQLADFSCEKEFFPFEKSVSGRSRRQIADLIDASKQAEVAQKCFEKANHVRDECVEFHKDGCSRTGLCILCYEQSQTHNAMNKAMFEAAMGYIKCATKMGLPVDQGNGH